MGDQQPYWQHGFYAPPAPYAPVFDYQARYSEDARYDYVEEGPAPSGLVHHPSIHPAVGSSRWQPGSLPSLSSSSQDFPGGSSTGSGPSPTTGSPPGGSLAPYNHARAYHNWGGPVPPVGELTEPRPDCPNGQSSQSALILDTGTGSTKIKPFISKLMGLLSDPDSYQDCIVWDQSGTSFVLSHANPRLLDDVLPQTFGHQNLQSFTRQLNVYDFKRLPLPDLLEKLDLGPNTNTIEYSGWYHEAFTRDERSQLCTMTPRPSRARQAKKDEKQGRLDAARRKSYGPN